MSQRRISEDEIERVLGNPDIQYADRAGNPISSPTSLVVE
jgi:hypothetical protein